MLSPWLNEVAGLGASDTDPFQEVQSSRLPSAFLSLVDAVTTNRIGYGHFYIRFSLVCYLQF